MSRDYNKERNVLEAEIHELELAEQAEVEPLQMDIDAINESYEPQYEALRDKIRALNKERKQLDEDARLAELKVNYQAALDADKMTPRALELIYEDATGVVAPQYFYPEKFRGQGMIKNGIQLIKIMDPRIYHISNGKELTRKDCDHVGYMAFYGMDCIGFTGVEMGKHPGDDHHPRSFLFLTENFPKMTEADRFNESEPEPLRIEWEEVRAKGTEWESVYERSKPMAYMDWVKELAKLTEEQLENAVGADLKKTAKMWMKFEGCW